MATPYTDARRRIRRAYRRATATAGGTWHALVTVADPAGRWLPAVDERADDVVPAASVNKLAVACAVLDKVDRGDLRLDQLIELTPDTVLRGDGIYHLQTVWGDRLTLANVLAALLLVSDNTAVRLCGRVCTGDEVNAYLAGLGCTATRVEPLPDNPRRMYLGTTSARETHTLLRTLAAGDLVSPAATRFVLDILRAPAAATDGVRHAMSSRDRALTAAKYGADEGYRHEAGVMFGDDGRARIVFSFLADLPAHADDLGATNPLVAARARLGRVLRAQVPTLP